MLQLLCLATNRRLFIKPISYPKGQLQVWQVKRTGFASKSDLAEFMDVATSAQEEIKLKAPPIVTSSTAAVPSETGCGAKRKAKATLVKEEDIGSTAGQPKSKKSRAK